LFSLVDADILDILDVMMAFGVLPIWTVPKNPCVLWCIISDNLPFSFSLDSFGKIEPSLLISVL
jgi:hypothetical protein